LKKVEPTSETKIPILNSNFDKAESLDPLMIKMPFSKPIKEAAAAKLSIVNGSAQAGML